MFAEATPAELTANLFVPPESSISIAVGGVSDVMVAVGNATGIELAAVWVPRVTDDPPNLEIFVCTTLLVTAPANVDSELSLAVSTTSNSLEALSMGSFSCPLVSVGSELE
jgi:hypothetical protein